MHLTRFVGSTTERVSIQSGRRTSTRVTRSPSLPSGGRRRRRRRRNVSNVLLISWIGKTGTELFTGSEDSYIKWWDIRKIKSPVREYLVTVDPEETDPEKAESVTCLAFEPTIPSKFMVGTRKGKIISHRMQPKAGSSNQILGVFDDGKRARVSELERNPFYPKNFLVIRDYSAKIWCEDIKNSPIMWMKQSPAR